MSAIGWLILAFLSLAAVAIDVAIGEWGAAILSGAATAGCAWFVYRAVNPGRGDERGEASGFVAILGLLVFAASIVAGIWFEIAWNQPNPAQVCHVKTKDAVTNSNGGHTYRVYTADCGVLDVSDAFWQGKFNSADVYNSIDPGKAYVLHTIGWRNGLFSQMPDIVSAEATK